MQIAPLVVTTRREIRTQRGWLKVIAADGPKQHGLILDMAICDELHAHARRDLYDALRTSMLKRAGASAFEISRLRPWADECVGRNGECRARVEPAMVGCVTGIWGRWI